MISKQELYAEDSDTPAHLLQYHITTQPAHGHIENSNSPTVAVSSFTQGQNLGCVGLTYNSVICVISLIHRIVLAIHRLTIHIDIHFGEILFFS